MRLGITRTSCSCAWWPDQSVSLPCKARSMIPHSFAHVPVQETMQTPVEQSDAKLAVANQSISQELAMTQQREQSRSQGQSIG